MSLQFTIRGKVLSVHIAIPRGSAFIFSVGHPVVAFLWDLSQGSLKKINSFQPLRIVDDPAKEENEENETLVNENQTCIENQNEATPNLKPELLQRVEDGLKSYPPELCEEGVNGTYFLRDIQGRRIAVFKPTDEEEGSENNPKKSEENSERVNRGIPQGEGAIRELAAFLLDEKQFSGVPQTFMATLEHPSFRNLEGNPTPKVGSLQEFIDNEGSCEDVGPTFPAHQVHKIGILDMRLFNNDRHGGNILIKETSDEVELVPIDHGLCLSTTLDRAWFEWLHWPQAKQPFNEESQRFIQEIDVERDAQVLRKIGIPEEAIRTMIISTTLLKKGAMNGLNLFQIGSIASREDLEQPSLLEQMVNDSGSDLDALFSIMDTEIANYKD